MSSDTFIFKQFSIIQREAAMKIGTDGVLLGAWPDYPDPKNILDIGTGTGLIALMLSQRFTKAKITAVEIDRNAAIEAKQNFENSVWKNRLSILNIDFFEMDAIKYDMLVCNPPYFKTDQRSPDVKRAIARNGAFSTSSFLSKIKNFMHNKSQISLIFPADQLNVYDEEAKKNGLFRMRTLFVKPTDQKPPNRILVTYVVRSENEVIANENDLIIEEGGRHKYSKDYKKLTSEFYLKF